MEEHMTFNHVVESSNLSRHTIRRIGGMADTGDLKSLGSNTVSVRVRYPAAHHSKCVHVAWVFKQELANAKSHLVYIIKNM